MLEVDIDDSGTVDFYEFLCVARLISQGKGRYKVSDRKNKRIQLFRKRLSYKREKAYATMSKVIMDNGSY